MKAVLYPYCIEAAPFANKIKEHFKLEQLYIASPCSILPEGSDASTIDNSPSKDMTVSNNWRELIDECELLIVPYSENKLLSEFVSQAVEYALDRNKDVIDLYSKDFDGFMTVAEQKKISYRPLAYFEGKTDTQAKSCLRYFTPKSDVPVVGVGKVTTNMDGAYTVLSLEKCINEKGYRAESFFMNPNCVLAGKTNVPLNIVTSINKGSIEAIEKLSNFMKMMMAYNDIDLCILEYPCGILKLSKSLPDCYGVPSYLTSMAVPTDSFVLCTPLSEIYSDKCCEYFSKEFIHKYGFEVSGIVMTNFFIELSASKASHTIESFHTAYHKVADEIQKIPLADRKKVCNQFIIEDIMKLADSIISELSS